MSNHYSANVKAQGMAALAVIPCRYFHEKAYQG